MGAKIIVGVKVEVDGVVLEEVVELVKPPARPSSPVSATPISAARREFESRMANWHQVVRGQGGGVGGSQYCAGWAKLYVHLRTSEAPPAQDLLEQRIKPLSPLVSNDELDGWLVEAAWRTIGDYNERMALKSLYIYRWPPEAIRRHLKVRGRQVSMVIAKAEKTLQGILKTLGPLDTIRSTTCLPG